MKKLRRLSVQMAHRGAMDRVNCLE